MKYSALAGGKRFRPILTYTVASLYDVAIEKVDSCACAIELIHIYSLIHDDLPAMDDDDIRHNQPTSHKVLERLKRFFLVMVFKHSLFKLSVTTHCLMMRQK
jgi:geranylgeranyl pyrophosphate synthase